MNIFLLFYSNLYKLSNTTNNNQKINKCQNNKDHNKKNNTQYSDFILLPKIYSDLIESYNKNETNLNENCQNTNNSEFFNDLCFCSNNCFNSMQKSIQNNFLETNLSIHYIYIAMFELHDNSYNTNVVSKQNKNFCKKDCACNYINIKNKIFCFVCKEEIFFNKKYKIVSESKSISNLNNKNENPLNNANNFDQKVDEISSPLMFKLSLENESEEIKNSENQLHCDIKNNEIDKTTFIDWRINENYSNLAKTEYSNESTKINDSVILLNSLVFVLFCKGCKQYDCDNTIKYYAKAYIIQKVHFLIQESLNLNLHTNNLIKKNDIENSSIYKKIINLIETYHFNMQKEPSNDSKKKIESFKKK